MLVELMTAPRAEAGGCVGFTIVFIDMIIIVVLKTFYAANISDAASAFYQAAVIYFGKGNRYEAATQYVEAAKCFRETDVVGE